MEEILLNNCIKQFQILLTSLKGYLQNMYKDDLSYEEIKHNLFTAIKIINTVEEVIKVYNNENK